MELLKGLEVTISRRRNLKIILFGVDPTLLNDKTVNAVLQQNEALKGASLDLRSSFASKRSRYVVLLVYEDLYERLSNLRPLNVGWCFR